MHIQKQLQQAARHNMQCNQPLPKPHAMLTRHAVMAFTYPPCTRRDACIRWLASTADMDSSNVIVSTTDSSSTDHEGCQHKPCHAAKLLHHHISASCCCAAQRVPCVHELLTQWQGPCPSGTSLSLQDTHGTSKSWVRT